jgi:hypothetical protein
MYIGFLLSRPFVFFPKTCYDIQRWDYFPRFDIDFGPLISRNGKKARS